MRKQSVKTSSGDLFARKGKAKPAGHLIAYERIQPSNETPDNKTPDNKTPDNKTPDNQTPDPAASPGSAMAFDGAGQAPEGAPGNDPTDQASTMAGSLLSIEFRKPATESEIHGSQGISSLSAREVLGSPASMQRRIKSSFQNPETEQRKPLKFSTPTDCVAGAAEPATAEPATAEPITAEPSRPTPMPPPNRHAERTLFGSMLAVAAGLCLIVGAWFVLQHLGGKTESTLKIALPETEAEAVRETERVAATPAEQADPVESVSAAEPDSTPDSAAAPTIEPNFDLIRVEPDGEAVIAGRAAPNAELILLDNGEPIGAVTANWAGEWAFIPEKPLIPGNHQFSLVVKEPQGTVTLPAPGEESGAVQPQSPDDPAVESGTLEAPGESGPTKPEASGSSDAEGVTGKQSSIPLQDPPVPPHKPTIDELADLGGDGSAHYMIQLSSTHSQTGAQKEWVKLTRIFPSLLDGMELKVHKATVDPLGTRYRVRTGQFADLDNAQALCQKFQSLDQECLVIKR